MATATSGLVCRLGTFRRQLAVAVGAVFGASAASGATWIITPEVTLGETYSSNVAMTSTAPERGRITDVAPGIAIDGASARVRGFLDFRRQFLFYSNNSDWNRHQDTLASHVAVEAVEKWLYVEGAATIAQRSRSAFGPTSVDRTSALSSSNQQTETKTTQISPYIQGRLANAADYHLRFNAIDSRSDDPNVSPTQVEQLLGQVKNQATTGTVGWFADGSSTQVRNSTLGTRDDTRIRAGVILPAGAHVHVLAFGGRESTDFIGTERQSLRTHGFGLEWSPSRRTQAAAVGEKRFFGNGHNVLLSHRTALTAWRYVDQKDVSILPTLLAGYNPGSIYELMSDLLESSIPDPIERARSVRQRMAQLGAGTMLGDVGAAPASRFFLDRRQELSVALLGQRSTWTATLTQRTERLLQPAPQVVDDFTLYDEDLRERRGSISVANRLDRQSTLTATITRSYVEGLNNADRHSMQTSGVISIGKALSRDSSGSVGIRRSTLSSTVTGAIQESALFGILTHRF